MTIDRRQTELGNRASKMVGKNGALIVLVLVGMTLTTVRTQPSCEDNPCFEEGERCNSHSDCCGASGCDNKRCVFHEDYTFCSQQGRYCGPGSPCCNSYDICYRNSLGCSICVNETELHTCIPTGAPCDNKWPCCNRAVNCDIDFDDENLASKCTFDERFNPECIPRLKPCAIDQNCCKGQFCATPRDRGIFAAQFNQFERDCFVGKDCDKRYDCCFFNKYLYGMCISESDCVKAKCDTDFDCCSHDTCVSGTCTQSDESHKDWDIGVDVQRCLLWVVAVPAVLGNMTVIVYRVIWDRSVLIRGYGLFVTNLGISDFIMAFYLFIIAGADYYYCGVDVLFDKSWRESDMCSVAGFLATFSCVKSTFFIFIITLDMFLVVKFPFGQIKFKKVTKQFAVIMVGLFGLLLALTPIVFQFEIYSSNAMGLGLPFTTEQLKGWELSFVVFIVLNFLSISPYCLRPKSHIFSHDGLENNNCLLHL